MADETTVTVTADTPAAPGTGTSAQNSTEGADTASTADSSETTTKPENDKQESRQFTQAELNAIVKKAETQAANKARAALEEERKNAELSEAEKQKKRADDAEAAASAKDAQLRRYAILDAARDEAEKQGLQFNPGALSDAYELRAFEAVEVSDDGKSQGVGDALKALAKEKPYLLKPTEKKPEAPDLDALAGGSGTLLDTPEAQRSRRTMTRGF